MEVDSVRATIERSISKKEIYSPANYADIMKNAKKSHPKYVVKYLDYTFFKDFSGLNLYSSVRPGSNIGDPVVTNLRALKYQQNGVLQYKLSHRDEYEELPQKKKRLRSTDNEVENASEFPQLFASPRPLTSSKFKNLQDLKPVIPRDYHSYYDSLPHE
ncbi:hypothetical protein SNE40_012578 [Patella caerulea]